MLGTTFTYKKRIFCNLTSCPPRYRTRCMGAANVQGA